MSFVYPLLILVLLSFQQSTATTNGQVSTEERARLEREQHRRAAIQINELAERIHSEADALAFVDEIAKVFADTLPPTWLTRGVRQRIAHAEYEAVSNPMLRIPEQRIVDVWNNYVREIGASEEALVTTAEIHNLRDADFATSQLWWFRADNRTIWTMPNVYAVDADHKMADGCRAIETLRVLYDLDMLFDNLRGARVRVRQGVFASDELRKPQEAPPPKRKVTTQLELRASTNPVHAAEYQYAQQHGPYVLNGVVEKLFDELFPPVEGVR